MKNTFLIVLAFTAFILSSCGGSEEKKEKFTYQTQQQSNNKSVATDTKSTPIDMDNQGIGPIKDFSFDGDIDNTLAATGEGVFKAKCTACHKPDQKFIGPSMKDIYERRNPTWVMNILLNPDEMLQKDPIAKALLEEYNGVLMINQNLTEDEARALAEYFRTL